MYFHIHSLPIFELKCEKILVCIKKNIFILWKVFKQFLFTSCNASKNLFVHCTHIFFFYVLQFVNRKYSCALSME